MTTTTDRFAPGSIGRVLETESLAHRRRRLERVVRALRDQRRDAPSTGLQAALRDFEEELEAIRDRMAEASTG